MEACKETLQTIKSCHIHFVKYFYNVVLKHRFLI